MRATSSRPLRLSLWAWVALCLATGGSLQAQSITAELPPAWQTRWFVRGEYLGWWTKGNQVPVLATSSPSGTIRADAGVLGEPGTQIEFGGNKLDERIRQGARLSFGYWLDPNHVWSLEGSLMYLGDGMSDSYSGGGDGTIIGGRPFFNTQTNSEDAQLVSFPNVVSGDASVVTSSEAYSIEALARYNWVQHPGGFIDLVGGYRFFKFNEGLRISEDLTSIDPGGLVQIGTTIQLYDDFATRNSFHGVQMGTIVGWERNMWALDVITKISLGNMHLQSTIEGKSRVTTPNNPAVESPGGLFAQPSNIGSYSRDRFAVIPELGVRLRIVPNDLIQFHFGYDFLLVSEIWRTGGQIDRSIDPSQLVPGTPTSGGAFGAGNGNPSAALRTTSMWLQGISGGVELRW